MDEKPSDNRFAFTLGPNDQWVLCVLKDGNLITITSQNLAGKHKDVMKMFIVALSGALDKFEVPVVQVPAMIIPPFGSKN